MDVTNVSATVNKSTDQINKIRRENTEYLQNQTVSKHMAHALNRMVTKPVVVENT